MFNKLKSTDADFSLLDMKTYLDIINKNVLYLTHSSDKCLDVLKKLELQQKLQTQVDEYFDKSETSPQTEPDEQ